MPASPCSDPRLPLLRLPRRYLISVLPFADEETLSTLEANVAAAGSVTAMLEGGASARDITDRLLAGLGAGDTGFNLVPT